MADGIAIDKLTNFVGSFNENDYTLLVHNGTTYTVKINKLRGGSDSGGSDTSYLEAQILELSSTSEGTKNRTTQNEADIAVLQNQVSELESQSTAAELADRVTNLENDVGSLTETLPATVREVSEEFVGSISSDVYDVISVGLIDLSGRVDILEAAIGGSSSLNLSTSQLINDSGFIASSDLDTEVLSDSLNAVQNKAVYDALSGLEDKISSGIVVPFNNANKVVSVPITVENYTGFNPPSLATLSVFPLGRIAQLNFEFSIAAGSGISPGEQKDIGAVSLGSYNPSFKIATATKELDGFVSLDEAGILSYRCVFAKQAGDAIKMSFFYPTRGSSAADFSL